jgi:hypothetical protein
MAPLSRSTTKFSRGIIPLPSPRTAKHEVYGSVH